ncbi:hypothetical protein AMATHDRAFT_51720 [Amanita thiersii Skay4041]|uniref:Uncharacterized protein n=1 Tax=Amanita thiersii Skay4041 TaxID=703135 RepID=A0A2A9N7B7_9AGAR|nr:hypothetical protein AMATHDRAFT_51720 [Amanita thiersii Skay4041]
MSTPTSSSDITQEPQSMLEHLCHGDAKQGGTSADQFEQNTMPGSNLVIVTPTQTSGPEAVGHNIHTISDVNQAHVAHQPTPHDVMVTVACPDVLPINWVPMSEVLYTTCSHVTHTDRIALGQKYNWVSQP